MITKLVLGGLLGAGLMAAPVASSFAAVAGDLIVNGGFEQTNGVAQSTKITPATYNSNGDIVSQGNVTGWSSSGYNFVFLTNNAAVSKTQADTIGSTNGTMLYGPGNGTNNGLTVSGNGGNFVAADNDYQQGPISQRVSNLVVGNAYLLNFLWAGAQQTDYSGATQEQWTVTFGNSTQKTANITVPARGFSGWLPVTMYFVANATQETLSFLATGTPGGQPPFSLLDGVSLVAAPEPATLALMMAGLVGLGAVGALRRRSAARTGAASA